MVSVSAVATIAASPAPAAIRPSVKLPAWLEVAKPRLIPLLLAIRGLLAFLNSYYMVWVGNKALLAIRSDVFETLPQAFFLDAVSTVVDLGRMLDQQLESLAAAWADMHPTGAGSR